MYVHVYTQAANYMHLYMTGNFKFGDVIVHDIYGRNGRMLKEYSLFNVHTFNSAMNISGVSSEDDLIDAIVHRLNELRDVLLSALANSTWWVILPLSCVYCSPL